MNARERIKIIQAKLEDLYAKKLQMKKNQSVFRWFIPDYDLKDIQTQIADLEKDMENYFKIIQVLSTDLECSSCSST